MNPPLLDPPAALDPSHVAAVQRRTVGVLVASQAVGALGVTIGVATGSLLAREVGGSDTVAGFAQTAQVLGSAAAAYGLARVMAARGRRIGQVTGMLLGAAGALGFVLAGVTESLPLLFVSAVALGAMTAANSASRYVATDLARPEHKARALSVVVWATTIGAVAGPNLTGPAGRVAVALGLPELTGPFLFAAAGMAVAALVVAVFLRPDPLLLARSLAESGPASSGEGVGAGAPERLASTWQVIRSRPALASGVLAMACAHAVMVSVMIMTPLHMSHGEASLQVIGLVISLHVLGMYAFSPLVGLMADRAGRPFTLLVGAGILMVALLLCARAPAGTSWQITLGLFLLGLGWSCATVSASTIVAEHAPLTHRTQVQGTADMCMWLVAAGGGALAGVVVDQWGYAVLAGFSAVLVTGVLAGGLLGAGDDGGATPTR